MQCSCGDATSTHHYQRIIYKDATKKIVQYSSQEICVNCGRASELRIRGTETFEKVKKR